MDKETLYWRAAVQATQGTPLNPVVATINKARIMSKRIEKASVSHYTDGIKTASDKLFDNYKTPTKSPTMAQAEAIQTNKEQNMKGMSPVEYRNRNVAQKSGVVNTNAQMPKVASEMLQAIVDWPEFKDIPGI